MIAGRKVMDELEQVDNQTLPSVKVPCALRLKETEAGTSSYPNTFRMVDLYDVPTLSFVRYSLNN